MRSHVIRSPRVNVIRRHTPVAHKYLARFGNCVDMFSILYYRLINEKPKKYQVDNTLTLRYISVTSRANAK